MLHQPHRLLHQRLNQLAQHWLALQDLLVQRLDQPDQMRDMKLVKQPDQHLALLLSLLLDYDQELKLLLPGTETFTGTNLQAN